VARAGWSVVEVADDADLDAEAVPGRSLLIRARS
jgi:hypothetical protein